MYFCHCCTFCVLWFKSDFFVKKIVSFLHHYLHLNFSFQLFCILCLSFFFYHRIYFLWQFSFHFLYFVSSLFVFLIVCCLVCKFYETFPIFSWISLMIVICGSLIFKICYHSKSHENVKAAIHVSILCLEICDIHSNRSGVFIHPPYYPPIVMLS